MQTDILLKQLHSSLADLKSVIDKFETQSVPSTYNAEELYAAIANSNKLVSAFLILKEKKDVAPDLDLHMKIMSVPTQEEKKVVVDIEPVKEIKAIEPRMEVPKLEPVIMPKTVMPDSVMDSNTPVKTYPKLAISINDKFRFISELFKSNTNEYNIAIEQLNEVNSLEDAKAYLKGLKDIYLWDEEHEMVKKLYGLVQKRFS